jgi:hypothetical protein
MTIGMLEYSGVVEKEGQVTIIEWTLVPNKLCSDAVAAVLIVMGGGISFL